MGNDKMINAVFAVVTNNLSATEQKGGRVRVSVSGYKLVVGFGSTAFAASITAKGWKPLPSMTALKGKKFYTMEESVEAVKAIFAAAAEAGK